MIPVLRWCLVMLVAFGTAQAQVSRGEKLEVAHSMGTVWLSELAIGDKAKVGVIAMCDRGGEIYVADLLLNPSESFRNILVVLPNRSVRFQTSTDGEYAKKAATYWGAVTTLSKCDAFQARSSWDLPLFKLESMNGKKTLAEFLQTLEK